MSNSLTPFTGSSRTLANGNQAGAAADNELFDALFSEKARNDFAKECKLGLYTNLSSDNRLNFIDLVPKASMNTTLSWFKSRYEKGDVPSKGVLSVPRLLVFVVRTTSANETGSVTIKMVDSGSIAQSGTFEPVDGNQSATIAISALPAIVCFSPSYDCPLETIGNRNRCFGIATELNGVSSTRGTVVMSHAYWSANLRPKPNNYKMRKANVVKIIPFDRLRDLGRDHLKRYVRAISDQTVDYGLGLGSPVDIKEPVHMSTVELVEDSPSEDSSNESSEEIAVTANSVAGLPVVRSSKLIRR
ncbi:3a protein [Spring beauty latent virus]|uniref:Movement protein n=1 Tax=Spring beauty latent virus TaxID=188141 RepID=Q8JW06_9BROM|nr:3a protein [Spring beauty latent virus]BAC10647.1 3a protein [Spring beauty latent virus]